jgi:hypothetical protein
LILKNIRIEDLTHYSANGCWFHLIELNGRGSDMRDPPVNKAWKQTLVELGLDTERDGLTTEA